MYENYDTDSIVSMLKVTCNPLCLRAAVLIEQVLGDLKLAESQASDSFAKYMDMKKACDDREDRIREMDLQLVALNRLLAENHPEVWARITKRITDERDEARRIAGTLLRNLQNYTDTPDIMPEFDWLTKEVQNGRV